jgi:hypothetical protein
LVSKKQKLFAGTPGRIWCLGKIKNIMENIDNKNIDPEVLQAMDQLRSLDLNRPMSELHPRFAIMKEALNLLVQRGEVSQSDQAYLAFMYCEQQMKQVSEVATDEELVLSSGQQMTVKFHGHDNQRVVVEFGGAGDDFERTVYIYHGLEKEEMPKAHILQDPPETTG